MSLTYEVQAGDTLIRIAHQHGFADWQTIWSRDENAGLRGQRDPRRLVTGDKVFIPDKVERWMRVSTDKRHVFELSRPEARLRVVLTDRFGQPLAQKPYRVTVDGAAVHTGRTDGDDGDPDAPTIPGLLDCPIAPDAREAVIQVELRGRTIEWKVELGALPPTERTDGLQHALQNLGYLGEGQVTGALDDATKKALRVFQDHARLPQTGEPDARTLEALEAALFTEAALEPAG